jgi:hypothetical protein
VPCFHLLSHRLKVSLIRSTPTEMRGIGSYRMDDLLISSNSLKTKQLYYIFGGESGIRS